ncbi:MAG TPA: DmsC/YnfH family molybdoenzyme membrane anchor subunit [Verrucomicrobiae bacterium]|jgi:Fe-S-cluster-containing dehydrogenase component/DMSO reductase anchor subunit
MTDLAPSDTRTLIDELLAEQRSLTAVDQFARAHPRHNSFGLGQNYRNLIPLAKPRDGEQYAFVVELDKCSGCKACVAACHSMNGLDENEMWRSVGSLHGERNNKPFQQTVTTACHHCVDPACLNGCPVLAYEKDSVTGIVLHLDDQCIGCQYCVMKCPYDVPKYSVKRGIVRKCDMCHGRLAVGEAPACVQSCPTEAIRIEIVNQSVTSYSAVAAGATLVPGAFPSNYTAPTTRYLSTKQIPATARSANDSALRLEAAHWPLAIMLVLTQLAGGLSVVHAAFQLATGVTVRSMPWAAMIFLLAGLTASTTHLGRPLKAWRAFLGWRESWMSREIIGFSIYAGFAALSAWRPDSLIISIVTAFVGLGAIGCSAMIYADTRRPTWAASVVFPKFLGATLLLGTTIGGMLTAFSAPKLMPALITPSAITRVALFSWEMTKLFRARHNPKSPLQRSARTELKLLGHVLVARGFLFALATALSMLAIFVKPQIGFNWAIVVLAAITVASQLLEKHVFFAACPAPRMPGRIEE